MSPSFISFSHFFSFMDAFDVMMTALRFNEKINALDLEGLSSMMTPDHTFVDRDRDIDAGRDQMTEGWRNFFERFPDYRNVFTRVQVYGDFVAIAGYATCSYPELDGSFLWSAKVQDGLVSEWRVYVDDEENRNKIGLD